MIFIDLSDGSLSSAKMHAIFFGNLWVNKNFIFYTTYAAALIQQVGLTHDPFSWHTTHFTLLFLAYSCAFSHYICFILFELQLFLEQMGDCWYFPSVIGFKVAIFHKKATTIQITSVITYIHNLQIFTLNEKEFINFFTHYSCRFGTPL